MTPDEPTETVVPDPGSVEAVEADVKTDFKPEDSSVMRSRVWTRRNWITFSISMTAGLMAFFWVPLEKRLALLFGLASRRHDNPYFRTKNFKKRKASPNFSRVSLASGFYSRKAIPRSAQPPSPRSRHKKVIQYVDAQGRVPFVNNISQGNLEMAKAERLALTGFDLARSEFAPVERVSLARASSLFEIAAMKQIEAKNYEEACQLLVDGIRHDLAFKGQVNGAPSIRLLDLLAKVSVRRDKPQHFDALLELCEHTKKLTELEYIRAPARRKRQRNEPRMKRIPLTEEQLSAARKRRQIAFEKRIKRWKDAAWQAEMKDLQKTLNWSVTLPPDTAHNINKKMTCTL